MKDTKSQAVGQSLPLRDFDHSLPMALLRAREAVMREFVPLLRDHQISPEQWRVLRALDLEDGLELAELSRRCYLLRPSMSRIAKNLEERELLTRKNSAVDQRKGKLFLTPSGHRLFSSIAPESIQKYQNITDNFGHKKLELLYDLLDDLVNSLKD